MTKDCEIRMLENIEKHLKAERERLISERCDLIEKFGRENLKMADMIAKAGLKIEKINYPEARLVKIKK